MKRLLLVSVFFFSSALYSFQGLEGRPLDLISPFLPEDPTILVLNGYSGEINQFKHKWPQGRMFFQVGDVDCADLIRFNLEEAEEFDATALLSQAKVVYVDAILFPDDGVPSYLRLKNILDQYGFTLLARRNQEGARTSLVFVKTDYFYFPEVGDYLARHAVTQDRYGIYDLIVFPQSYLPIQYYLDNDADSVKETLKSGYAYEGNISLMIYALTKPGSIAIDVGAHIGVHTIFMSKKVGPHGAVIAFEPNKKLYMEHLANMQLNDCQNVISICKGLGDSEKKVSEHGIEIEQNESLPLHGETETIDIVPLDSYHFEDVSLIKMDIENYEYFVLRGGRETILRNKPLIVFESWINHEPKKRNQEEQRKNFLRVMSLLESYGYEIYIFYNCDFLAIPVGLSSELLMHYRHTLERLDPNSYIPRSV